jgi:beta-lactamase class A
MPTRNLFFLCTLWFAALTLVSPSAPAQTPVTSEPLPTALAELEKSSGGRLGVAVLDLESGEITGWRSAERFPMCSTFKAFLVAAVLQRVDAAQESLERRVAVPAKPLLINSPVTERHAGGEITVRALCEAVVTRSDNTGANLLLDTIGGPAGLTRFVRSVGDEVTRLDRTEMELNECRPGDPRDTTSPAAAVNTLRALLLGEVLSPGSRDQLKAWMIANRTGDQRLRAKLPGDWRVGDKTGADGETTTNDLAIFWPPGRKPVIVAAYLTECAGPESKRNAVLAEVGRLTVSALQAK